MIRSEDEEGVVERVRVDDRLKQQAQAVIDIADRSGVLGPHPARVTFVEVPRGAQLPVVASLHQPVGAAVAAIFRRRHGGRIVHPGEGRRTDEGSVRLVTGVDQREGLVPIAHPADELPGLCRVACRKVEGQRQ